MLDPTSTIRTAIIPADDLSRPLLTLAVGAAAISVVLLGVEVFRARARGASSSIGRRILVVVTGLLATLTFVTAIVRPQRLRAREVSVAPRVVVLLDRSRSMALPEGEAASGPTRIDVAERSVAELRKRLGGRVDVLAFGNGAPKVDAELPSTTSALVRADEGASDLATALRALAASPEDAPSTIVVVSDGAVALPDPATLAGGPKIHAVAVGNGSPKDASIRAVHVAGAAVAHQALALRVEVGCTGGLSCGDLTVTVRELREPEGANGSSSSSTTTSGGPSGSSTSSSADGSELLATGTAAVKDGTAIIELPVTIERAGTRALEVSVGAPKDDAIPENDRRLLTLDVARERVRVLHIAGRPSFDVRALRTWLKSDAAMDVVSFFILRTPGDDVSAPDEELALIPFPVRELFTEYLPSFDAIIFQDFDAEPYGLTPHLPAIARYVEKGGGLVHIGGPNSFSNGGYAGTALARVTPVEIPKVEDGQQGADSAPFVPVRTPAARASPILAELEALLATSDDDLPAFPGTNVLGDTLHGGVALWTHPKRKTASGKPMPVLAIGDIGDGRSIALGLDSTRLLASSASAAKNGGRGFDALFRGLLGWLMRDVRYEPVRGRLAHASGSSDCLAGAPAALRIEASPVLGPARLRAAFSPLTAPSIRPGEDAPSTLDTVIDAAPPTLVPLGGAAGLPEGAWAIRLGISERDAEPALGALATRTLGACERGGSEWADSRPNRESLEKLTKATGGVVVVPGKEGDLPAPTVALVALERTVSPILPAWAWGALAALALSLHWFVRRRTGLA